MDENSAAVIAKQIAADARDAAFACFTRRPVEVAEWFVAVAVLPEPVAVAAVDIFTSQLSALAALN